MTIQDALKESNLRIISGYRWLVRESDGLYVVYERKPYAKKTTIIICTDSEERAVAALLGDEEK
jgi:hypothetical protein